MDRDIFFYFFFIFLRCLIDSFFLIKGKLQYLYLTSRRTQKLEQTNFASGVGHNKATICDIIKTIPTDLLYMSIKIITRLRVKKVK
jgi:hypothetical protein